MAKTKALFIAEGNGYLIILSFCVIDVKIILRKGFNPSLLPHVEIKLSENPFEAPMTFAKGKHLS